MSALLGYHLALLLRSQRWLPPLLLYVGVLGVGIRPGQPVLDTLGFAAAPLLFVAAWLVRVCVTNEPPAARSCVAAPAGPGRAHLACLTAGFLAALVPGLVGLLVVTAISEPSSNDHRTSVPLASAAVAGLLATLVCALVGAAVGAVTNRPLLHSPGRSILAMLLVALLALVVTGSPVRAALSDLVTGSQDGTVRTPVLPLALGVLLAAVVAAAACALTSRRE